MSLPTKEEMIKGTLDWCNSIREEQGKPTLAELPKGDRNNGLSCPCGEATGMFVGRIGYQSAEDHLLRKTTDNYLPNIVQNFVCEFDAGHIPELIAREPK